VQRIRALIVLLPSSEGGRTGAIASGYTPSFRFDELYTAGAVQLIGRSALSPGEEADADIVLANPDHVAGFLRVGATFDITEGRRKIGSGIIHSLLDR
jgi:elongation factor Tu